MTKEPTGKFQTHIREPRWQQVVSVVLVVAFLVIEALVLLRLI